MLSSGTINWKGRFADVILIQYNFKPNTGYGYLLILPIVTPYANWRLQLRLRLLLRVLLRTSYTSTHDDAAIYSRSHN